jgi:hypothetical protein
MLLILALQWMMLCWMMSCFTCQSGRRITLWIDRNVNILPRRLICRLPGVLAIDANAHPNAHSDANHNQQNQSNDKPHTLPTQDPRFLPRSPRIISAPSAFILFPAPQRPGRPILAPRKVGWHGVSIEGLLGTCGALLVPRLRRERARVLGRPSVPRMPSVPGIPT